MLSLVAIEIEDEIVEDDELFAFLYSNIYLLRRVLPHVHAVLRSIRFGKFVVFAELFGFIIASSLLSVDVLANENEIDEE